jgi:hypothetical protein
MLDVSLLCSQKAVIPILIEMHPVHTFPQYFPKKHYNIILICA